MTNLRKIVLFSFLAILAMSLGLLYLKDPRPYLTVVGNVKMADGIGRQAPELLNALCDEMSVGFISRGIMDLTDVPSKILPLLKSNKTLGHVIIYEESLPVPNRLINKKLKKVLHGKKTEDQIRIAYSMYEFSLIPKRWTKALNRYFDAVAVPDPFLVDVYKNSGVEIPIFVVPLALEMDRFLNHPLKRKANKPFCFVNTSSLIPRKNPEALILAFHKAFKNDPEVQLKINYRYDKDGMLAGVSRLLKTLQAKNIHLQNKPLTNQEYLEFLSEGDAFVTFSKGEGFSIQPREAMALGMPVIISNNTAHETIANTGLACAVSCPFAETEYNPFTKCTVGDSYFVDIDEAAKAMRDVYDNYEEYLKGALKRRQWASQYTFKNLKPFYVTLVKPKQVILGEKNEVTADTLITDSKELYEKYSRLLGVNYNEKG